MKSSVAFVLSVMTSSMIFLASCGNADNNKKLNETVDELASIQLEFCDCVQRQGAECDGEVLLAKWDTLSQRYLDLIDELGGSADEAASEKYARTFPGMSECRGTYSRVKYEAAQGKE